jgi:FHA domain-containing protein
MISCANCATKNIDGSEYCDECGMKLDLDVQMSRPREPIYVPPSAVQSDPPSPITSDGSLPAPPSFTTSTSMPKPAMPGREPRKQTLRGRDAEPGPGDRSIARGVEDSSLRRDRSAPPQNHGSTFVLSSRGRTEAFDGDNHVQSADGPKATLIIERGGRVGREFSLTGIETNIGRWDADSGIFPDVDLDEDDPEAKISRRHARIINQQGQYFIEDLGSTNGTFVNRGRRLLPGKRQVLQSGDEIIVGKTFLKFQILR